MRPRNFLGAHYKIMIIEGQITHRRKNLIFLYLWLIHGHQTWDKTLKKKRWWSENWTWYNKPPLHTTPIPAITRPTTKVAQWVSSCKPTPRERTMQDTTIPHLRPTMSPIGNAKSAPKKVPAERMDTYQIKQPLRWNHRGWESRKGGSGWLTTRLLRLVGRK